MKNLWPSKICVDKIEIVFSSIGLRRDLIAQLCEVARCFLEGTVVTGATLGENAQSIEELERRGGRLMNGGNDNDLLSSAELVKS